MFIFRLLYIVGVCNDFLSTNFQPGLLEGLTFHTCEYLLAKVQIASGKLIERYTTTNVSSKFHIYISRDGGLGEFVLLAGRTCTSIFSFPFAYDNASLVIRDDGCNLNVWFWRHFNDQSSKNNNCWRSKNNEECFWNRNAVISMLGIWAGKKKNLEL